MMRLRLLVAVMMVVASSSAHAEVLASLGTSVLFETSSSGRSFDQRAPMGLRGGYRFEHVDVYGEYSRFNVDSGVSMVEVTRSREQLLVWARTKLRPWSIAPFVAAGIGELQEKVDTRFGGDSRSDSGQLQGVAALSAGAIAPSSVGGDQSRSAW